MFARAPWSQVNGPLLASSFVMMCFAVVGVRIVFTLPLTLASNWIFRITSVRPAPDYLAANRKSLLVLAVAPVWVGSGSLNLALVASRGASCGSWAYGYGSCRLLPARISKDSLRLFLPAR